MNKTELQKCVDYNILRNSLSETQLDYISLILDDYVEYQSKYDDGVKDIIGEFINDYKYSTHDIVAWYEGMESTEELIKNIKGLEW